jgi:hypothetical protein
MQMEKFLRSEVHSAVGSFCVGDDREFTAEKGGTEFASHRPLSLIMAPPISFLVQGEPCSELRGVISPD